MCISNPVFVCCCRSGVGRTLSTAGTWVWSKMSRPNSKISALRYPSENSYEYGVCDCSVWCGAKSPEINITTHCHIRSTHTPFMNPSSYLLHLCARFYILKGAKYKKFWQFLQILVIICYILSIISLNSYILHLHTHVV